MSDILSDVSADGTIVYTPPSTFNISSAFTSFNVLAGVDPSSLDEYRGFLDFPLGGSGGVPLDATIVSATVITSYSIHYTKLYGGGWRGRNHADRTG